METLSSLRSVYRAGEEVLAQVTPEDLDRPTPCPDWDLRRLINHFVGTVEMFTAGAHGERPERENGSDRIGIDWLDAFKTVAAANLDGWERCPHDATIHLPFGQLPKPAAMAANLLDTLAHVWDTAQAIGTSVRVDQPTQTAARTAAVAIIKDEMRAYGAFGAPVAVGDPASDFDHFLAITGRVPA